MRKPLLTMAVILCGWFFIWCVLSVLPSARSAGAPEQGKPAALTMAHSVYLGMSQENVRAKLGEPDKIESDSDIQFGARQFWYYRGADGVLECEFNGVQLIRARTF